MEGHLEEEETEEREDVRERRLKFYKITYIPGKYLVFASLSRACDRGPLTSIEEKK